MRKYWKEFLFFILLAELVGAVGATFVLPSLSWYDALAKPSLTPPASAFGPVWFLLYFLIGLSAYVLYRHGLENQEVKVAISLFIGALALNLLWPMVFFGLKDPLLGFIVIIALVCAVAASSVATWRVSKLAACLLVPYLLWVIFAIYLNFGMWQLQAHPTVIPAYASEGNTIH